MTFDPGQFIGLLYDATLFGCATQLEPGQGGKITMERLAGAFRHVQTFYDTSTVQESISLPLGFYIQDKRLDGVRGLKEYIESLTNGYFSYFPYAIKVYSGDCESLLMVQSSQADDGGDGNDGKYDQAQVKKRDGDDGADGGGGGGGAAADKDTCGGDGAGKKTTTSVPAPPLLLHFDQGFYYAQDYVHLRGLWLHGVESFLTWYTYQVPSDFQDVISAFCRELRDNYWNGQGFGAAIWGDGDGDDDPRCIGEGDGEDCSGGWLRNGLRGVVELSRAFCNRRKATGEAVRVEGVEEELDRVCEVTRVYRMTIRELEERVRQQEEMIKRQEKELRELKMSLRLDKVVQGEDGVEGGLNEPERQGELSDVL